MAVKMPKKNGKNGIKQVARFGLFWAIIIFVALIFYAVLFPAANLKEAALSDVVRRANEGKIAKLGCRSSQSTGSAGFAAWPAAGKSRAAGGSRPRPRRDWRQ